MRARSVIALDFREGGNGGRFRRDGWSQEEDCGTWALGQESTLILPRLEIEGAHHLKLQMVPFVASPVPRQRVELLLNGITLLAATLTEERLYTLGCPLPAGALQRDADNLLTIRHHAAAIHDRLDLGIGDPRELSLRLLALSVDHFGGEARVPAAPRAQRSAIVTTTYNEAVNLPLWHRYYARAAAGAELVVLDHGSTDGSVDDFGRTTVIRLPRSDYDDGRRAAAVNDIQHALVRFFDSVVYVDCDEFLVPDPALYGDLGDYLRRFTGTVGSAVGLNLLHAPDEAALDLARPLLRQRHHARFDSGMSKPAITTVPVNWAIGFHESGEAPQVDPDLYNIHLKAADRDIALARHRFNRALAWSASMLQAELGAHQRTEDAVFLETFFEAPGRRIASGEIEPFDFTPELDRLAGGARFNGRVHAIEHFSGRIVRIPERFADCL